MKMLTTLGLLVVTLLTGCKKNMDVVTPTTTTFPKLLAPGIWTITSFSQGTEDKLKVLGNISIDFSSEGKATATQNKESTSGSWAWGGNSYYGTPADSKTVTLSLGTKPPYDRLSKTWTISDATRTLINLENSNPAEKEHLTLSK